MNELKYITQQDYHWWLNDCPIKWIKDEDNITTQTITFHLPLEDTNVKQSLPE
jgi:hypothetical protein